MVKRREDKEDLGTIRLFPHNNGLRRRRTSTVIAIINNVSVLTFATLHFVSQRFDIRALS